MSNVIRFRRARSFCGLCLALYGLAHSVNTGAAANSYPLMCRGGGEMTFHVYNRQYGVGEQLGDKLLYLKIWFEKDNKAITEGPLKDGSCTWTDRGMSSSEPGVLIIPLGPGVGVEEIMRADGTLLRYEYIGDTRRKETARNLIDSILQGTSFQVQAAQEKTAQGNYLLATRVGP